MSVTHQPCSAPAQVDVAVGPGAARVRGRTQLAQQAQLLEPRLELGAEDAPLDPLERAERRLHRRPLALGAEVGAEARAEVAGAADVEHLLVPVAEEVDARRRRRAGDEVPLAGEPPRARRGEVDELRHGRRARLLREPDQREQDLGGRLGVGERAVARPRRRAEEVRERGEADALLAAGEQPAREPDGVDHRRRDPAAGQPLDLAIEEAHVEARVVGDEDGVAGELEEAAHAPARPAALRAARSGSMPVSAAIGAGSGRRGLTSVSNRSSSSRSRTRTAPISQIAEEPGREPGRLEVDDDVGRALERERRARRLGEPDARPAPGEPRVAVDDVRRAASARDRAGTCRSA